MSELFFHNHGVNQSAEALNLDGARLALLEKLGRRPVHADSTRGARENDVAGLQRADLAQPIDDELNQNLNDFIF